MTTAPLSRHGWLWAVVAGLIVIWAVAGIDSLRGVVARNRGFLAFNRAQMTITGPADDESIQRGIDQLEQATSRAPSYDSAWRALGYLYYARGEESQAIDAWRQAGGDVGGELLRKGVAAEAVADSTAALDWYRRATAVQPGLVDAWLRAGDILEQDSEWDTATEWLAAGSTANPTNSDLHFRLARVHRRAATAQWPDILELTERAIEQDEFLYDWNLFQSHLLRADGLREMGDLPGALAEVTWVMERRPDDYWATLGRADLIWRLEQQTEEAERLFLAAIAIDPTNKWAYRQLAEFYVAQGRANEAKPLFERVIQLDPNDQIANEWLSQ